MTEKRFTLVKCYNEQWGIVDKSLEDIDQLVLITTSKSGTLYLVNELNALHEENEQLKQQRIDLLRLIENNIEIYENINTNVEFHKGEIQGKLTLLYNLRKVILND